MSWTTSREVAAWFAERWRGKGAHVYTVTAAPDAILADVDAILGDGGRGEHEVIVDPSMLPRLVRVG